MDGTGNLSPWQRGMQSGSSESRGCKVVLGPNVKRVFGSYSFCYIKARLSGLD